MAKKVKVFGIGMNKTGTTTLGRCLKILGYKHISHSEQLTRMYHDDKTEKLIEKVKNVDSLEDWPWPLMYRQLAQNFPDAKFVLTVRKSPEAWLKSLMLHSYKLPPKENYHDIVFGFKYPLGHEDYHLEFYNKHNKEVIEYFSDKPGRLLVVCWENGDGWEELCSFLNIKKPRKTFPHEGAMSDWSVPKYRIYYNHLLALSQIWSKNKLVN